jgi:hypothetical protein
MKSSSPTTKSRVIPILMVATIGVTLFLVGMVQVDKALKRAALAETLNNIRSLKFALDGFANDFDGQYPSDATSLKVISGGAGDGWSNDYFRQLFLSGETQSERIFWVKGSPMTSASPPDDEVARDGKPLLGLILEKGDCHWAYVLGLSRNSPAELPLLLDPFASGTSQFDPALWDKKAIVMHVDGSAAAHRLNAENGVSTSSGEDIFSPGLAAWAWYSGDPLDLVVQPQPAKP